MVGPTSDNSVHPASGVMAAVPFMFSAQIAMFDPVIADDRVFVCVAASGLVWAL